MAVRPPYARERALHAVKRLTCDVPALAPRDRLPTPHRSFRKREHARPESLARGVQPLAIPRARNRAIPCFFRHAAGASRVESAGGFLAGGPGEVPPRDGGVAEERKARERLCVTELGPGHC